MYEKAGMWCDPVIQRACHHVTKARTVLPAGEYRLQHSRKQALLNDRQPMARGNALLTKVPRAPPTYLNKFHADMIPQQDNARIA